MRVCVYVLVSDTAGGTSSWGRRGEDDEWCSALQLFLNGKSPIYRLVTGKRSLHSGMNSTCSARSRAQTQWPEIPSHIRLQVTSGAFLRTSVDWLSRLLPHHSLWSLTHWKARNGPWNNLPPNIKELCFKSVAFSANAEAVHWPHIEGSKCHLFNASRHLRPSKELDYAVPTCMELFYVRMHVFMFFFFFPVFVRSVVCFEQTQLLRRMTTLLCWDAPEFLVGKENLTRLLIAMGGG